MPAPDQVDMRACIFGHLKTDTAKYSVFLHIYEALPVGDPHRRPSGENPPPHSHYGDRRLANHRRGNLTAHLRGRSPVLTGPTATRVRQGPGTPMSSRRLCGSLAFEARIRRSRSTVASRLVRKAR